MVVSAENRAVRRFLGVGENGTVVMLDGVDVSGRCLQFDAEAGWAELAVERENGALVYDPVTEAALTEYHTGQIRAWSMFRDGERG